VKGTLSGVPKVKQAGTLRYGTPEALRYGGAVASRLISEEKLVS
jgi:hypothetical protein